MPGSSSSRTWVCGRCRSRQVEGEVDRLIPYYDYDEVLAYVLRNHTDVLTARNTIKAAEYSLKLARVTPVFPMSKCAATSGKSTRSCRSQKYYTGQCQHPVSDLGPEQGQHPGRRRRAGPCR